ERRFRCYEQLDQWFLITRLALWLARFVLHVTQLVQVFVFARGNVVRHLKQPREKMIEERDQWRLTAEVQQQRLLFTSVRKQRRGHLAKHVNVRAAKAVDRLLAVADNEEIRRPAAFS